MTEPADISGADQHGAKLRHEWAPQLGEFFRGLLASGFERGEAVEIIVAYQAEVYAAQSSEDEEPA